MKEVEEGRKFSKEVSQARKEGSQGRKEVSQARKEERKEGSKQTSEEESQARKKGSQARKEERKEGSQFHSIQLDSIQFKIIHSIQYYMNKVISIAYLSILIPTYLGTSNRAI